MTERAMQRLRRMASVSVIALVLGLVATSCQDPTEIVIEVRTNVPYRAGIVTAFTVGAPGTTEIADSSTETRDPWGADGFVGSLVLVPDTEKTASVAVKVVMGIRRDPRECLAPAYAGCIVARRKLSYLPHERLRLPMVLYANCENVACDPNTTCSALGQCISSSIDPGTCNAADGCVLPGDPKPGFDAGGAPVDGATDGATVDASMDGATGADAAADSGGDASIKDAAYDGPGDPGTIAAGMATCPISMVLCLDQSVPPAVGRCAANDAACNPGEKKMHCDGREDCGAGFCCDDDVSKMTSCSATACPSMTEVCLSLAPCGGVDKQCTANSGGISVCRP